MIFTCLLRLAASTVAVIGKDCFAVELSFKSLKKPDAIAVEGYLSPVKSTAQFTQKAALDKSA